mmetsp:Transcript_1252/g.1361  ORF Transcript_1252/g.1361 Transcript_1252/m.1361 type:complete len:126 (-) Transcript_1252:462-839(-)
MQIFVLKPSRQCDLLGSLLARRIDGVFTSWVNICVAGLSLFGKVLSFRLWLSCHLLAFHILFLFLWRTYYRDCVQLLRFVVPPLTQIWVFKSLLPQAAVKGRRFDSLEEKATRIKPRSSRSDLHE